MHFKLLVKMSSFFFFFLFNKVMFFLFLVNYFGQRPWWPIQSPNKGRKRNLRGEGDKIAFVDFGFWMSAFLRSFSFPLSSSLSPSILLIVMGFDCQSPLLSFSLPFN